MTPMIERVEAVHPDVARALRARSGMERLRQAHETWEMVRDRLAVYLANCHLEWSPGGAAATGRAQAAG